MTFTEMRAYVENERRESRAFADHYLKEAVKQGFVLDDETVIQRRVRALMLDIDERNK